MGLGGISIWQLAIVLLIVVLIFGTKRLKSIGGDLGSALKGFKKAMNTDEDEAEQDTQKRLKDDEQDAEQDAEFPERKKSKSRNA